MKKVYIAHKYQGKRQNKEAISHICRELVKYGVLPISPIHAFGFLNDHVPEERAKAMEFCLELLEMVDEIWFFGDYENSVGCQAEWDASLQLFKPIRVVTGWKDGYPVWKGDKPKWWRG